MANIIDWVSNIKTEYKRGKIIRNVAKQITDRRYTEKTGKAMTPGRRADLSGGIRDAKELRDYDKDLGDTTKNLKSKMKSKGAYKGLGKVAEKLLDV